MPFGQKPLITPLDAFDAGTWRAIITLPLQIGRWMADIDTGGGPETRAAENAAIPRFLNVAARKFANIPLIAHIIAAAQNHDMNLTPLSEEALFAKAAEMLPRLRVTANPLEVNAYRLLLIEMAEHVARAGSDQPEGAYNLMNGPEKGWYGLYPWLMNNLTRYGRGPRVSLIEKQAINRLIDTLQADGLVQKWQIEPKEPVTTPQTARSHV